MRTQNTEPEHRSTIVGAATAAAAVDRAAGGAVGVVLNQQHTVCQHHSQGVNDVNRGAAFAAVNAAAAASFVAFSAAFTASFSAFFAARDSAALAS